MSRRDVCCVSAEPDPNTCTCAPGYQADTCEPGYVWCPTANECRLIGDTNNLDLDPRSFIQRLEVIEMDVLAIGTL